MMKWIRISTAIAVFALVAVLIFFNLPLETRRSNDIELGNQLIANIENYQGRFGHLPRNDDWEVLEQLGFREDNPFYNKINDVEYEILYLEGFDPPYFFYNSREKKWKEDFPSFAQTKEMEKGYPWTTDVIETAKDAILISIENMQKPEEEQDPNFPTNKYNIPFSLKEKKEFQLSSFTIKKDSDIYEMEFQPVGEYKSGSRFTVDFDIKKSKAICVYMKPDA